MRCPGKIRLESLSEALRTWILRNSASVAGNDARRKIERMVSPGFTVIAAVMTAGLTGAIVAGFAATTGAG